MPESSTPAPELARKLQSMALRRVARVGQNKVADEIGVSTATVSRFFSEPEGLERVCRIFAHLGFKLVPVHMQCFEPSEVKIFMDLSRKYLNLVQHPEQLQAEHAPFEDDE